MIDIQVQHHFSSGVYAKQMHLPAGHFSLTHAHPFDHLSILAKGVAMVDTEGVSTKHVAPACITIKAGMKHTIIALEDTDWFCIHATDETDPEKVDQVILGG